MVKAVKDVDEDILLDEDKQSVKELNCARRVLLAGIWLIENGYGKMMLLPYVYATGHWRCEFHPQGRIAKTLFRYTIANEHQFLASHCGGTVRKDISVEKLAQAILVSVPEDMKDACSGTPSPEIRAWIADLRRELELGRVPEAFGEYFGERTRWKLADLVGFVDGQWMPAMPGYIKPGEEYSCLDDPFWSVAELRARRLAKLSCVALPSSVLHDDETCFTIGNRLRRDMADAEPFEAMRLLRAAIGALHIEAGKLKYGPEELVELSVCTEPSTDPTVKRATRLLSMVHELHKAGYQRLRIAAGWDPLGQHWRARLMPASAVSEDGWSPLAETWRVDYCSEQGKTYFGWTDTASDDARALANKFLDRFPEFARCCEGQDWPYAGWFAIVLGRAEFGELPAFYGGRPVNEASEMPPPQLGVTSQADPDFISTTGHPLIPNDELLLTDLPPERAPYEAIWPFCLSYDGYKGGLISIDDCWGVVAKIEKEGLSRATIDELRTAAFIHQRRLKNQSDEQPIGDENPSLGAIRSAIEELRRRI
jgi:hypothetical protein